MNVLIEGPNGSGKSTLADYVKNLLQYDLVGLHHRPGDQYRRYLREYARDGTVFVRGHWSEVVYSVLFGRPAPFTNGQRDALRLACRESCTTVVCVPTVDLMLRRHDTRLLGPTADSMREKRDHLVEERDLWCRIEGEVGAALVYKSESADEMRACAQRIIALVRLSH